MLVDRMQILVVMTTLVTANRNNYNCVSCKEIVSYNYVPRFQNEVLSSSVGGLCLEFRTSQSPPCGDSKKAQHHVCLLDIYFLYYFLNTVQYYYIFYQSLRRALLHLSFEHPDINCK